MPCSDGSTKLDTRPTFLPSAEPILRSTCIPWSSGCARKAGTSALTGSGRQRDKAFPEFSCSRTVAAASK
jgi:hypothetical protein